MKYKIGDVVKIREDLECGKFYGKLNFISNMKPLRGTYVTIEGITTGNNYNLKETFFILSEEMFEDTQIKPVSVYDILKKIVDTWENKNMKTFKIVDYKVHDNDGTKSVVVEFGDGTKEHAVCCKGDTFELERGVEVCLMKHIFGETEYKSMLRKSMKQIKEIDKAAEDKKKEEELIARKKAKNEKRKARHKANRRARRVAEMREAYLGALKEYGIVGFFEGTDDAK